MEELKIVIPDKLKKDIQDFGNNIAKNISLITRDLLTSEYAYAVEQFYDSYAPIKYKRKWQLYNSYKPYYKNPHKTRCHGGVEICVDQMEDVHRDSNEIVLGYALAGYHGNPKFGIYTPPWIYEHMINYRDTLFNFIEFIVEDAISKAKQSKYSILQF